MYHPKSSFCFLHRANPSLIETFIQQISDTNQPKMKIIEKINQPQQTIKTNAYNFNWFIVYDVPQVLELSVSAETANEVGSTVGLIQNVAETHRVATYENGVTLALVPKAGTPCLDATDDTTIQPYYNEESKGRKLAAIGEEIRLKLEDSPGTNVATKATRPGKPGEKAEERSITQLSVREKFLLSLWEVKKDKTVNTGVVVAQWDWEYSYTVVPVGGNLRKLQVTSNTTTTMVKREKAKFKQDIKLGGTIATEDVQRVWTPTGWQGLHWP